eukprot:TRINITY_DN10412_c0_g1_i1.p1 TRINITY_DN10412_c0_g1~~TRINITY_DN10412_c0_g1_i1.p1  ORF type:complete len:428 (-),score=117.95 TRINITY_DN10412_c0_g1_i1:90-1346(-)
MPDTSLNGTDAPKSKAQSVLLLEKLHPVADKYFQDAGMNVIRVDRALGEDELIAELESTQCVFVGLRSKTKITRHVLQTARHNLLAIGCFCIGTNQVDIECAAELGIPVFNSPFCNSRSVAELIISEIVILSRRLGDCNNLLHQGVWHKSSAGCHEIRDKVLGIVGYGHIGSQLSILADAMGMHVIYYDILKKMGYGRAVAVDTLEELLTRSDYVTLHVPDTPDTRGMIDEEQIQMMKCGAMLLNASRGTVVNLDALSAALKSKHLAGAAVDVYPSEPKQARHEAWTSPLQGCPNTFLTPHIGGSTMEAQEAIGNEVADVLVRYRLEGSTQGSVNFPQVALTAAPEATVNRIAVAHENHHGVMGEITGLIHDYNIAAISLSTKGAVGYLLADLEGEASEAVVGKLRALTSTTSVRICQ